MENQNAANQTPIKPAINNQEPQIPVQKNNTSVVIILSLVIVILIGVLAYLFGVNQGKNAYKEQVSIIPIIKQQPVVTEQPNQESLKPTIIDVDRTTEKGKAYLTINMVGDDGNKKSDIYVALPKDSTVKYQSKSGYINSTVTINNIDYSLSVESGGRGGPCPMEDYGSKCGYDNETIIPISNVVTIDTYRVWHDEKGIFLLNPQSLTVNGFFINNLLISKNKPNNIFTRSEVDLWRGIIQSVTSNI